MKRGGFGPRATPLSHGNAPLARTPFNPREQGLSRTGVPPSGSSSGLARTGRKTPAGGSEVRASVRSLVYKRDDDCCVRCGKPVGPGNRQLQHRQPRGMGGRDGHEAPSNLLTVCGAISTDPNSCHHFMEANRLQAQAGGWLIPWGSTSLNMPVLYADGVRYLLDDSGDRRPA